MRVCFDLRALQTGHENRGIGMYIRSLLEHLPASDNHYIFYAFEENDPIKALGIKLNFEYELVQTPTLNTAVNSPRSALGLIKIMNHRFGRLKAAKPDVFVQFDFNLGLPRWPRVQKL